MVEILERKINLGATDRSLEGKQDDSSRVNGYSSGELPDLGDWNLSSIPLKDQINDLNGFEGEGSHIESGPIYRQDEVNPVALYIQQIGQRPLLTGVQEVELAKQREKGIVARDTLTNVEMIDSRVRGLLDNMIESGEAAQKTLIESNLRLVVSVARRYQNKGLPLLDLINEGNMGLMRAIEKYDWRRGFKLSTYGTWWIRQKITRAIADQARTIRHPVHMNEEIKKVGGVTAQLRQELGRDPTRKEIADRVGNGMTEDKVQERFVWGMQPVSLETPIGDEDSTLGEMIADENEDPEKEGDQELLREDLDKFMRKHLTPRERKVLRLRYGLDGKENILNDIGNELGITRERTRQIEAKALQKMRENPAVLAVLGDWLH